MKSGKNEAKLGHNDGGQPQSAPIPKHPHILIRDGRCYYRRRIPLDLVRLGCYGNAKDRKRSLKTSDLAIANRLAKTVALEVDEEFEAKRREFRQAAPSPSSNGDSPGNCSVCKVAKRRLADLSEVERRDFIIRAFIANEKVDAGRRSREGDIETRESRLDTAREDLMAIEGSPLYQEIDWLTETRKALEAEGIWVEGPDDALLRDLADRLRRARVESAWRTERAANGKPFETRDPFFKAFHPDSPMPTPAKQGKTVGDLCSDYLAHNQDKVKKRNLARSTIPKIEMRCRILTDFFGKGKLLASITREDAASLVDFLATIPQNAAKRYKGASLVFAAEREAKLKTIRLVHPKTAEDYMTGLSAMLTYAKDEGWLTENPLKGRRIRERLAKAKKQDRQALTPDEMARVFSTPEFLALRHGGRGAQEARFWVPVLCLFHGTRANEVAGMRVSDVMEDDGIACLDLRETDEHRLKTETSARKIPLHRQIISLGFLKFVSKRRADDPEGYLFAGLARNRNGSRADGVCKWWQRFVTRILGPVPAGGPTGARGIHSLRHSWKTAARSAGLAESISKHIGGWSQADAAGGYGWSGALPMLKQAIDKIEFPKVDFSALSPTNDA